MRTNGHLIQLPAPIRDAGLLLARVLLGVILIAHGWQKLHTNGIDATTQMFEKIGVTAPHASAWFAGLVEFIGGVLLALGLLTPIAGLLVTIDMVGAWWFAHRSHGVFDENNGWELVAALGLASLVFTLIGPGHWSVDGLIERRRSRHHLKTAAHHEPLATATDRHEDTSV